MENGIRGEAIGVSTESSRVVVRLDGSSRQVEVAGDELGALRLAYAGHVFRQQGATVDRAVVVTGGWQTSRETAYVEASRARHGVEWHVARDELDGPNDTERIGQLAGQMATSRAQEPSLQHDLTNPLTTEPFPATVQRQWARTATIEAPNRNPTAVEI